MRSAHGRRTDAGRTEDARRAYFQAPGSGLRHGWLQAPGSGLRALFGVGRVRVVGVRGRKL